ncbi:fimbrin-2 [Phtheirospermum japonicum]|uniref:Fimbrin-2 n=1 Tax=Phtheirospermum japonicum TaxID=374723 RepID=A0A830CVB9_9LAMI|nr:fimbrin-2 [Phtheirospermum japonicum]
MAGYFGVLMSDPWLQNQFTQVELRSLKSSFTAMRRENKGGGLKMSELPEKMSRLKHVGDTLTGQERDAFLRKAYQNLDVDVDFELFLRVYLKLQALATEKRGTGAKNASAFLKSPTSTLLHTISEPEKASYIQLLADLNLKKTPQLVELVDDSKDVEELMSLAPEKILLRWMNFQLKKGGYMKTVTNFSSDVKDAEAYAHLLNVLAPEHINPSTLKVKDPLEGAKLVLEHSDRMGCKRYLTPKDIVEGSPNLNLAFVAHIFQHSKCAIMLMRCNMLQLLKNLRFHSHGKEIIDADILEWANSKVENSGTKSRMSSFKDKSLSDGLFFLELLNAVRPTSVNWSLVTKASSEEEKKMNATYIISIARKLGCSIFLLPEDIIEVNQKVILTLTASIMYWTLTHPKDERSCGYSDSESGSLLDTTSNSTMDDTTSESSVDDNGPEPKLGWAGLEAVPKK